MTGKTAGPAQRPYARRNPFRPKPCRKCGWRLSRARLKGYCITCARIAGILPRYPAAFRRLAEAQPEAEAIRIPGAWQEPRPSYQRVADGITYDVVWSGD